MDEEIERLIVSVRADTGAFARDVAEMRGNLEGPFADGVDRAGRRIETSLARAIATGKVGFDDLGKLALQVLSEIATAAVRSGIDAVLRGGSGGSGGGAGGLLTALLGLPGRATGGPVSPGAAYLVGERGPELFVPTSSGRVAAPSAAAGSREVRVAITVNARGGEAPAALQQSSRQVARAVRQALMEMD
ncbi:tail tape measure protein [Sphingomonas cannabina]|uniref:tail tape measure protein n=1 Tax=Sphingomonas cannabina TaxID=2899123 RepID=UPI001F2021B9|nr:tail tape measure protein [Sphingomonas cannabina]UIJ45854.1 tail tape measure protein [Sphingomonas cannabina]